MQLIPKKAKESYTIKTELVLATHTNILGNLLGGTLLHWMDIAAAISASRHSNRVCVTVGVDNVEFYEPIPQKSLVIVESKVTRAFKTSMEVKIKVFIEDLLSQSRKFCNEAYFTFVALDQFGKPTPVPPLIPETEEEKKDYEEALKRRELRLLLAGKMKPEEAHFFELKYKNN